MKKKIIERKSLSTRLPIFGIEDRRLPVVYFRVIFNNGSLYDKKEKKGLSYLLTYMLLKGNNNYLEKELNLDLDKLGASLSLTARNDYIILFGRVPSENFNKLISIVDRVLNNKPIFSQKEFKIAKSKANDFFYQIKDRDSYLASYIFSQILYKKKSYAFPHTGVKKSLLNIELKDLNKKYNELMKSDFKFLITGDYSQKDVLLIEKIFNNNSRIEKIIDIDTYNPNGYELYYYNKPEKEENYILMGNSSISIKDKNIYSLILFNKYFGSDFTSLLSQELREKKGWTYSAYSSFNLAKYSSSYSLEYSTDSKNLIESLSYVKNLYENINLNQKDLDSTINKIEKSFYFKFSTTLSKLNILSDMIIYDYPQDFFDNYLKGINLSHQNLKKSLTTILKPRDQIVVLVGNIEDKLDEIKKLNIFSKIIKITEI
jgi:zinc protease